jgi:hypothetical protein
MTKSLTAVAAGLALFLSAAAGASAQLLEPSHGACHASSWSAPAGNPLAASPLAAKVTPLCTRQCYTSEGGTSPTMYAADGTCAEAASDLASQLAAYALMFCRNYSGLPDCNYAEHVTTGCLVEVPGILYEYQGYATFNCYDNNC